MNAHCQLFIYILKMQGTLIDMGNHYEIPQISYSTLDGWQR